MACCFPSALSDTPNTLTLSEGTSCLVLSPELCRQSLIRADLHLCSQPRTWLFLCSLWSCQSRPLTCASTHPVHGSFWVPASPFKLLLGELFRSREVAAGNTTRLSISSQPGLIICFSPDFLPSIISKKCLSFLYSLKKIPVLVLFYE